jgi:hypothetical protein
MNKIRQIYVVGSQTNYANWMIGNVTDNMHNADVVVFTGGEDVSPELYSMEMHPQTHCSPARDAQEVKEFNKAFQLGKPCVGICRGAQLLCVMAGGQLIQHQSQTGFYHRVNTFNDRSIQVTSCHHQAQYPWMLGENDFRVLGWTVGQSAYHEGENKIEMVKGLVPGEIEIEDCHYPHIRALCIQGHPEMLYDQARWDWDNKKTIGYYRGLMEAFLTEFPNAK